MENKIKQINRWEYVIIFFISMIFTSCNRENFEQKIILKSIPDNVVIARVEAGELREYRNKLNSIDVEKILLQLKEKTSKEEFKYRLVDMKIAYNKSVESLQDVEHASPNDIVEKKRKLKESLVQLDSIWKYVYVKYKI